MWILNEKTAPVTNSIVSEAVLREVLNFHASFPGYAPTPFLSLKALAARLGVQSIYIKDESKRFGLNSFKSLGGSYAIGKYLAGLIGTDRITFDEIMNPKNREKLGEIVFATATDGNHGRGVAWMAKQLNYKAKVFMPKGTTSARFAHIASLGAEVEITDCNYDETVRMVAEQARKNGWIVVQDTAWEGYIDIPTYIMQGYTTVAQEMIEGLGDTKPTHLFLQAGVGAFASVMAAAFLLRYGSDAPKIVIVEPENADCFYRSAVEGKSVTVTGELKTIMAGLSCGEPNPIGYAILKDCASAFVSVPDYIAADGMRVLGGPAGGDARVVSGESGAVTLGAVYHAMTDADYAALAEGLGLGPDSNIVLVSTEGDTDPVMYDRVVWEGAYAKPDAGCL